MRAADVMTADPVYISPDASIADAVRLMLERKFSGLPVVDACGALIGIVTPRRSVARKNSAAASSHRAQPARQNASARAGRSRSCARRCRRTHGRRQDGPSASMHGPQSMQREDQAPLCLQDAAL
jgi:CBS-domain-containing membrane protein